MKRILSVFLIVCLMLTMLVVSVPAVADGGPYTITFVQSGNTIAPASYNEGAEIAYPAINGEPNRQGDWVWSLNETTFEAVPTVMPAENITVYALVREGFFTFENYYCTSYIGISGRVRAVKESDGNTVIKFDNTGIPFETAPFNFGTDNNYYTKSYSGETAVYTRYTMSTDVFEAGKYYHASATLKNFINSNGNTMEAYNAIDLGQLKANKGYAITVKYRAESIASRVYVEPVIWCKDANNGRNTDTGMTRYKDNSIIIESASNGWVTTTVYITTPETFPSVSGRVGDQLRLVIYSGEIDKNNVVYFDDVYVREFVGANLTYNYLNGTQKTEIVEVGTEIDYAVLAAKNGGDNVWSAVEGAYIAPATVMSDSDYQVYEFFQEGFFGFENYYRNNYLSISGRVQPVQEDGNTIIKFDNKGIPLQTIPWNFGSDNNFYTKEYVNGEAVYKGYNKTTAVFEPGKYYHGSAVRKGTDTSTDMDTYNAIELGKVTNGALYEITVNYKREKVVSPVTVSPRSWKAAANVDRAYQVIYNSKITIPATDTPDSDWQTETIYITANTTNGQYTNLDQLRLVIYTPGMIDVDNVVYFDDISVKKIEAPYIFFDAQDGKNVTLVRGEVGDTIVPPTVAQTNKDFLGWFTDEDCTVPFTLETFAADTAITVYAGWEESNVMVYDFEDYNPNQYIAISGRVQPIEEDGNTIIKFDNKGIPLSEEPWNFGSDNNFYTKEYVNGEAVYKGYNKSTAVFEPGKYYHGSAVRKGTNTSTDMDTYNAIELGKVEEGVLYKITVNYKREKVVSPVTVSPRSWKTAANVDRAYQIIYNSKITIPATDTPDTQWQTQTVYIEGKTSNGEKTNLDQLRLVIYTPGMIDVDNVVYFDNIVVEKISAPYIFYNAQNGENSIFVKGVEGEAIVSPSVKRYGQTLAGWYLDQEYTTRFTDKVFSADTAVTLYARWETNRVRVYDFENYNVPYSGTGSGNQRLDGYIIETKDAYSGNQVLQFDRTVAYNGGRSLVAVAYDEDDCELEADKNYLITMKIRFPIRESQDMGLSLITASHNNYGANASVEFKEIFNSKGLLGISENKWHTAGFIVNGADIIEGGNSLYIKVTRGLDSILWIDDITVTALEKNEHAVFIHDGGSSDIPSVLIGKVGTNYSKKLPTNPQFSGMKFLGYYSKDSAGNYDALNEFDMQIQEGVTTVFARFVDKKVIQNFDSSGYAEAVRSYDQISILDFDYELYDSLAAGNSKDNVTSGRYSLHRKGNSPYIENALVLTFDNKIAEGQRYTITFKVKMGEYKQTNGAVKIVSGKNHTYAWSVMGDYYPVVPIADLLDGKWHEVSYTFNSVEPYVVIQTPGYVELFIDDIVFTLVDSKTPLSLEPIYTDYVQALLDEDGNIITEEGSGIDISSIIDASLTVGGNNNSASATTIILISAIGGGVVLLLVVLAVVLILVKRKKKKAKV